MLGPDQLGAMAARGPCCSADLIIEGAVAIEDGRAISDPADPNTGVRTQLALAQVEVERIGEATAEVLAELSGPPSAVETRSSLRVDA